MPERPPRGKLRTDSTYDWREIGEQVTAYTPLGPPPFSWTGCYFGGNVGGKWARTSGSVDIAATTGTTPTPASSFPLAEDTTNTFVAGGQVGCDLHENHFLFGIEGEVDGQQWSKTRIVTAPVPAQSALFNPGDTFKLSSSWEASLLGRIGFAWNRLLFYGNGGVAFTNMRLNSNFVASAIRGPAVGVSTNKELVGAAVGGGFEFGIWEHMSVGIEGRYIWYGRHSFDSISVATAPVTTTVKLNTAEVLAKLNFRFGGY